MKQHVLLKKQTQILLLSSESNRYRKHGGETGDIQIVYSPVLPKCSLQLTYFKEYLYGKTGSIAEY